MELIVLVSPVIHDPDVHASLRQVVGYTLLLVIRYKNVRPAIDPRNQQYLGRQVIFHPHLVFSLDPVDRSPVPRVRKNEVFFERVVLPDNRLLETVEVRGVRQRQVSASNHHRKQHHRNYSLEEIPLQFFPLQQTVRNAEDQRVNHHSHEEHLGHIFFRGSGRNTAHQKTQKTYLYANH